jgi:hypothetical protein
MMFPKSRRLGKRECGESAIDFGYIAGAVRARQRGYQMGAFNLSSENESIVQYNFCHVAIRSKRCIYTSNEILSTQSPVSLDARDRRSSLTVA